MHLWSNSKKWCLYLGYKQRENNQEVYRGKLTQKVLPLIELSLQNINSYMLQVISWLLNFFSIAW